MSRYDDDDDVRPPQRKSGNWLVIALILGVAVLGAGVLACCGGVAYFGINVVTTEVETALRDNPTLREHVGEIQKFTLNFTRTVAEDKEDVWVYDVVGSKASGELTVHHVTGAGGKEQVRSASLRLKDGTTVELIDDAAGP